MSDDFSELQTLLRLKRHENPPPGYLEDFLAEFHRRQRAELLRRPLWRIALDRVGNLVPTFPALPVPNLAYAGASAVALVAAAGLLTRYGGGAAPSLAGLAANNDAPAAVVTTAPASVPARAYPPAAATPLAAVRITPDQDDSPFDDDNLVQPAFAAPVGPGLAGSDASGRPRYLLDTRPVRYESRAASF